MALGLGGGAGGDVGAGIGGSIADIAILLGAGGKGGTSQRKKIVDLWNKLETSNFDLTRLSFPELKMVKQLMPNLYTAVTPPSVQTVSEDPALRAQQMAAAGQMSDIATQGQPLADRLATRSIQNDVASQLSRNTEGALRQIALRGGYAPGVEAQYRAAAGQTAGNTLADLGANVAGQALQRRMAAIGQAGALAGQARSQDYARNTYNANAINNFNAQMANIKNEAARYNAAAQERAQGYNTSTAQNLATQEALGRAGYAQQERNTYNDTLNRQYQQQIQKLQGQQSAYGGLANALDLQKAARERQIQGIGEGVGGSLGGIIGAL